MLATNPIGATPVIRIAEAALQIRGDAGEHQATRDIKTAVATALGGPNWTALFVLKRSWEEVMKWQKHPRRNSRNNPNIFV